MAINNIVLCYSCDAQHTNRSKKVVGVFSTVSRAIKILVRSYGERKFSPDDLKNLQTIHQTQGKEENFILETIKINRKL